MNIAMGLPPRRRAFTAADDRMIFFDCRHYIGKKAMIIVSTVL